MRHCVPHLQVGLAVDVLGLHCSACERERERVIGRGSSVINHSWSGQDCDNNCRQDKIVINQDITVRGAVLA